MVYFLFPASMPLHQLLTQWNIADEEQISLSTWWGTKFSFLYLIREEREQKLQRKLETTIGRKLPHGSFRQGHSFLSCCAQHLFNMWNYVWKLQEKIGWTPPLQLQQAVDRLMSKEAQRPLLSRAREPLLLSLSLCGVKSCSAAAPSLLPQPPPRRPVTQNIRPRLIEGLTASCPCHSVVFSSKVAVFSSPAGLDCWTPPVHEQLLLGGLLFSSFSAFMAWTGLNSVLSHHTYAGPVRVMNGARRGMNAKKIWIDRFYSLIKKESTKCLNVLLDRHAFFLRYLWREGTFVPSASNSFTGAVAYLMVMKLI